MSGTVLLFRCPNCLSWGDFRDDDKCWSCGTRVYEPGDVLSECGGQIAVEVLKIGAQEIAQLRKQSRWAQAEIDEQRKRLNRKTVRVLLAKCALREIANLGTPDMLLHHKTVAGKMVVIAQDALRALDSLCDAR